MDRLRRGVLEAGWDVVLATVEAAHGWGDDPGHPAAAAWREPEAAGCLPAVHEATKADRHATGTYYTPDRLVGWVLDRVLRPDTRRVLDPACGAGAFLVPAVRRLAALTGRPPAHVVGGLHGTDLDPVAVAITRLLLRRAAPDVDPAVLAANVRVADGLAAADDEPPDEPPHDVVVGNPPFLGQLRRRTARAAGAGPAAYTDTSALFLRRSLDRVRPGGRVALVQPWSLLAARDAAPVRRAVTAAGSLTAFWSSSAPVFLGTDVATCVPVVERGAPQDDVPTWHGPDPVPGPRVAMPPDEWGPLVAPALGVPAVRPRTAGVLGELATAGADFRDQYYGLVPYVREAADVPAGVRTAPLVTSGLVDPAVNRWARATTRFAKTAWTAPVVDLDALEAGPDARLARWARARLVPKVLVATQGRVLEAVVDEHGAWLPSVPVVSVTVAEDDPALLYRVVSVLLAPPVVAHAAARYAGTALSVTALKLAAGQVATLPLPADTDAWHDGARHARAAHLADDGHRAKALQACAEAMCAAYGDDTALAWWLDRAGV